MITKIFLFAVVAALATPAFASKTGLVDMQKAIESVADGKKAKTELESEYSKRKKNLEKLEADIKKMGDDFQKKANVLSDDTKTKKQSDIQNEMRKYQEAVAKNQMEMQKRQNELTQPIIQKIRKVIQDIAKRDGFEIVQEKSEQFVLYANNELDLTDRVIKGYDSAK